jgi:hypothetical protein
MKLLALSLLLLVAAPAWAAGPSATALVEVTSTQPASTQPAEEQARAVTQALLDAMAAGDDAKVNSLIAPDADGPNGSVKDIVGVITAAYRLERAAYAKLGDDKTEFAMGHQQQHQPLKEQLDSARRDLLQGEFKVEGDLVMLYMGKQTTPVFVLEHEKDGWKLLETPGIHLGMDIGRYHVGDDPEQLALAIQVFNGGADAIKSGRTKNAKDAWALMESKMAELLAEKARAEQAGTPPAPTRP